MSRDYWSFWSLNKSRLKRKTKKYIYKKEGEKKKKRGGETKSTDLITTNLLVQNYFWAALYI